MSTLNPTGTRPSNPSLTDVFESRSSSTSRPTPRPAVRGSRGRMRSDFRTALAGLADLWRDGLTRARTPLSWAHIPAIIYLLGVAGDTITTSFLGLVPGVAEGNPFALAGMNLLGGPQLYMLLGMLVLAPLTILLAGKPRTLLARGMWGALLLAGFAKFGITASNTYLLLTVTVLS